MRILYIAPCLPHPPDKGERIRACHHVRYLAGRHEVHLACLTRERPRPEDVRQLEQICASVEVLSAVGDPISRGRTALAFALGGSLSVAAFHSGPFAEAIRRKLQTRDFDCILVFSAIMAGYVQHAAGTPRVIDFVDVDSELWRQSADRRSPPASWAHRLEARRLARHEAKASGSARVSIFVSESEADLFRRRVPESRVAVVANGVDLEHFAPRSGTAERSDPPRAVFAGTMDYEPNVDAVRHFCHDILPRVRCQLPSLEFWIVGRRPSRAVKSLARLPGVTVTGRVGDVRPYLERAGVVVAPFRMGTGIQNKVLEAMASGVPVVGTARGFAGLDFREVAGVRLADRPTDFAREIVSLIRNRGWAEECAQTARRYVERHHRWHDQNAELERLLRQATAAHPVPPRAIEARSAP